MRASVRRRIRRRCGQFAVDLPDDRQGCSRDVGLQVAVVAEGGRQIPAVHEQLDKELLDHATAGGHAEGAVQHARLSEGIASLGGGGLEGGAAVVTEVVLGMAAGGWRAQSQATPDDVLPHLALSMRTDSVLSLVREAGSRRCEDGLFTSFLQHLTFVVGRSCSTRRSAPWGPADIAWRIGARVGQGAG